MKQKTKQRLQRLMIGLRLLWACVAAVVVGIGVIMKAGGLLMVGDTNGARREFNETF